MEEEKEEEDTNYIIAQDGSVSLSFVGVIELRTFSFLSINHSYSSE